MKTLTLNEEFTELQKFYGKYYIAQMFNDFYGYKEVRAIVFYTDILEELLSLEQIEEEWN
jgi:hypothetical protein|tara:strand:- start:435 stop:614 length:180 start_codon:yes stop_codon:yes gene_type:complete